jgi:alkylhydroperoxidase/carboxymuconolactone decarboxylase family protein YurZ
MLLCRTSHRAIAAHQLEGNYDLVDAVCTDYGSAPISQKLKTLLAIAGKVQIGGKNVTTEDIARAKAAGATDIEIHDTVLIAAAFCMFNRYVDGLDSFTPTDQGLYDQTGARVAQHGYKNILAGRETAAAR